MSVELRNLLINFQEKLYDFVVGLIEVVFIEVISISYITSINIRGWTICPGCSESNRSNLDAFIGIGATRFSKESTGTALVTVYE